MKGGHMSMKKNIWITVILILLMIILSLTAEAASRTERKLKEYYSKEIPDSKITSVKIIKTGDVVRVTRREFLTNRLIQNIEKPVLLNIQGKCLYGDKKIDLNIKTVFHKDEWGDWVPGQGTITENSLMSDILTAGLSDRICPEDPSIKINKEASIGTYLDPRTNLMWAAKDNGEKVNWFSAKKYCENYSAGGYKDWRMPTIDELDTLYDPDKNKIIDSIKIDQYHNIWSSEAESSKHGKAAAYDFRKGERTETFKSSENMALPVRGTWKMFQRKDFIANADGTVIDTRAKLMWAAKDNGEDINWHDAKKYCENYRGGGYTDWRMPTPKELINLFNNDILRSFASPIKVDSFGHKLWTSETDARQGAQAYRYRDSRGRTDFSETSRPHFMCVLPVRTLTAEELTSPHVKEHIKEAEKEVEREAERLRLVHKFIEDKFKSGLEKTDLLIYKCGRDKYCVSFYEVDRRHQTSKRQDFTVKIVGTEVKLDSVRRQY